MRGTAPGVVRVRLAGTADLARIQEIEEACFSAPWSPDSFRSLIGRPGVHLLVAEVTPGEGDAVRASASTDSTPEEPRVVAYGVLWRVADEAELANLAVEPDFRGLGIARRLLERLLSAAVAAGVCSVFLEVRASNEAALALYLGRGFHEVGRRRHYYERPREDARVLRLTLGARHRTVGPAAEA